MEGSSGMFPGGLGSLGGLSFGEVRLDREAFQGRVSGFGFRV